MFQVPRERLEYQAHLKGVRDMNALLAAATSEGEARGRARAEARGAMIGRIELLQQLLGLPSATSENLAGLDLPQLESIESDLLRQYRERFTHDAIKQ